MTSRRCTCYIRLFHQQARSEIRWGAHALDCPSYRESGDPVDRAKDEKLRESYEYSDDGFDHNWRQDNWN
jgi:hypothetical protein